MNQFLPAPVVGDIVRRAFRDADALLIDTREGYDIRQDLAWQMRIRVTMGDKTRTCYLFTLDLLRDPENLLEHLKEGWAAS